MNKSIIETDDAPSAIGTYCQAVKVQEAQSTVYLSGQIPLDPKTMEVVSQDFKIQSEQVFKNLSAVAKAAGGSLSNAVKLTIYLTDLAQFPILNEVMAQYFNEPYPARVSVQVSALPKQVQVEVDAVLCL